MTHIGGFQGPKTSGGGTLGLLGWGCAAGTLKPLAYTTEVASTVQPKQNRFDFFICLSGNSRFP